MTVMDRLRYDGKRALVVGGATGMGAAAAKSAGELGAEVIVMDYAPVAYDVAKAIQVDLRDPASIDAAVEQLGGPVHGGVLGRRHRRRDDRPDEDQLHRPPLSDRAPAREQPAPVRLGDLFHLLGRRHGLGKRPGAADRLLGRARLRGRRRLGQGPRGGRDHPLRLQQEGRQCLRGNPGLSPAKKGVRINAICPGPTDTPLAQANADLWLTFAQDYRDETSSKVHTPEQMGDVMAFLNSAAAFGINGITVLVDYGHTMASLTGAYPPGKPIIDLIMGRVKL